VAEECAIVSFKNSNRAPEAQSADKKTIMPFPRYDRLNQTNEHNLDEAVRSV
jgi:hypothetical protein